MGPVYRVGDFTTSGSIEGAILSGLRAANQILEAN
jgi:predicted NAD/FAD-dependent oxidoreductase